MQTLESVVGPSAPRRGNALSQALGRWVLTALGWTVTGQLPDVPRCVVIGAPHTSNRDGLLAAATIMALRLRITVLGKDSLFRGPLGALGRWLGGIPVRRDSREGVVEQMAERFAGSERLYLGLSPEGTRHRASQFRSGFYRIAERAGVPIVVVALDYGRRQVRIMETVWPSGDLERDMTRILALYRGVVPCRPERLSLPLREGAADHSS